MVSLFVDVDHVSSLVVAERDVLLERRFQMHVLHRMLDAVERRGEVIVAANHQHLYARARHRGAQNLRNLRVSSLIPRLNPSGRGVVVLRLPVQLAPHVILPGRNERALVGVFAGVAFGALAGRLFVVAFKASIQASDCATLVALQLLEEALRRDAQVGILDVRGAEARNRRHVGHRLLLLRRRGQIALLER